MLWHTKDANFWGISISHTDANQLAAGPDAGANPFQYYISPLGIRSLTFSAQEFTPSASGITLDTPTASSVNLNLHANRANPNANQKITLPLVQGMGFVTARYYGLRPVISSGVIFRTVTAVAAPREGLQKFVVILEDGKRWIIYACPAAGSPWINFSLIANSRLVASEQFTGFIQIAKVAGSGEPTATLDAVVDSAAGAFAETTDMEATVSGQTAWVKYKHRRWGTNNAGGVLTYALPHHITSFSTSTVRRNSVLRLRSPTHGMMVGVVSDEWVCEERALPTDIGYIKGAAPTGEVATRIRDAARRELQQDMDAQTNLDSMYFSGKVGVSGDSGEGFG